MLALGGCVARYPTYSSLSTAGSTVYYPRIIQPSVPHSQTVALENADRIARFQMLASTGGDAPSQVDELYAPPGTDPQTAGVVPVVHVVFDEGVFFDSGSDVPRPEALPVLDKIAEDMRSDVPGAQVTVLGHTDAVGGDAYNMDLSERRALHVLRDLMARGVNPGQLSTVAIGKRQPIAPNDTPEGRAQNRRVEFLISASLPANLAVVQERPVDIGFLAPEQQDMADQPVQSAVQVLRPREIPGGGLALEQSQMLDLRYEPAIAEPGPDEVPPRQAYVPASMRAAPTANTSASRSGAATPAPSPRYVPNVPEDFHKQDLGPAQPF